MMMLRILIEGVECFAMKAAYRVAFICIVLPESVLKPRNYILSTHTSIMHLCSADCTGKTSLTADGDGSTLSSAGGMATTPQDELVWPPLSPAKKKELRSELGGGGGCVKICICLCVFQCYDIAV